MLKLVGACILGAFTITVWGAAVITVGGLITIMLSIAIPLGALALMICLVSAFAR
jgi:hypothetical protein